MFSYFRLFEVEFQHYLLTP